jgi:hypothetical protein
MCCRLPTTDYRSLSYFPLMGDRRGASFVPQLVRFGIAVVWSAIGWTATGAQTPAPRYGTIIGTVVDSLHNEPLAHAEVGVEGTTRVVRTDADGNFRVDSVPAGLVRLGVFHPLLDSLGLGIASPALTVRGGDTLLVTLATPSAATFAASACREVARPAGVNTPDATGPGEIVGRVLDADTDRPIKNVEVSVTWVEVQVGKQIGYHRDRHTRGATTGPGGDFRLCHLPLDLDGSLRALRRDGGAAAQASTVTRPVQMGGHLVTLVTLHMAAMTAPTIAALAEGASVPSADTQAAVAGASAPPARSAGVAASAGTVQPASRALPARHYAVGSAELSGHVVSPSTQPVVGARVFVVGAADSGVTSASGDFALHQLPSGTRILVVRALGFEPVTMPVELTSRAPLRVNVPFRARSVPILAPVLVTARYDSGLKRVGFDQRRALGLGTFWTKDQIDSHKATEFHALFGTFSGVIIDYSEDGRASLLASRAAGSCIGYAPGSNGKPNMTVGENCGPCLTYVIDGAPYDELEEGDMDTYIRPSEIGAIEVYLPSQVPHSLPGVIKPDCLNVVVWSRAKLGI